MTAMVIKTAARAHARYHRQSENILRQVNLTLWTGSAGDQHAAMFCGLVETATGRVCCSSAGPSCALVIGADGATRLGHESSRLGEGPETQFEQCGHELRPGDALVIVGGGIANESDLIDALQGNQTLSAEEVVAIVREAMLAKTCPSQDFAVLAVKRTV